MATESPDTPVPATGDPRLSVWDAICLIVGIIIGASIYETSPSIFRSAGSPEMGMIAWVIGGVVSLIGALCYAELASAYRSSGGDYTYLTRAYGSKVGFIFAWAELSVIRTGGSIAFMAYVFARYATEFYDLGPQSKLIYAVGGILFLTLMNAIGVRQGRWFQNTLTTANIVGLSSVALIGLIWFIWPGTDANSTQKTALEVSQALAAAAVPGNTVAAVGLVPTMSEAIFFNFALTMVFVFYAYGGWNEAAFISSEVKNPKRNVRRSLIIGTSMVMAIYIAVNAAYLGALGYCGVCRSEAIAADMFALPFGNAGRKIISALVMISALGSVHGLLFTGMRLYGTFGKDHRVFAWLSSGKEDEPHAHGALFAQALFSLLLIGMVELGIHWRQGLMEVAGFCGLNLDPAFQQNGDIKRLVACTAPVFWIFFLLTGCSLFVLRWREPDVERPFRVPLYPVLPLIFVLSCAFMLWKSAAYALEEEPAEAIIVASLMLLGIPLCFFSGNRPSETEAADPTSGTNSNELVRR
jgi:basic amino acid/polyamine antiporter, APA family